MSGRSVAFGPFLLDPETGTLFRGGDLVPIGQKGALLLGALAGTHGKVWTKAELMDVAWAGVTVEESNLSVQIASLRKALGAAPGGGEWIATVPRVGYRFLAPADAASAIADATPGIQDAAVIPSLAVLPFQNMSGDPEQEYFADGIVEDIITALSRFKSFAVVARNSSFVYKGRAVDIRQVARELGVRYVLEGSVRRAGQRLRITAQLIDGATGAHIWADKFDGGVKDVFDVQDRITESTIGVIEPQIRRAEIERSRRKRPENLDAYDFYLRALAQMYSAEAAGNAEAYAQLRQAIGLEPDYGPFLAGAIWILTRRVVMDWPPLTGDDRETAIALVARALAVADGDATVLAQCGATLMGIGREYDRGLQIIANAVAANPNNQLVLTWAAVAELHCGDVQTALGHARRAVVMSPGSPTAHLAMTAVAHAELVLGQYREAVRSAEQSLAVNANYPPTYWMLIAANAHLGNLEKARRWLVKFRLLAPAATIASIRKGQPDKDPARLSPVLEGMRLSGLSEG